ncbi:MAG: general stress protein [Minisyncoccia bacterium]
MDKSVVAIYGTMEAAEGAVKDLIEKGYPANQLSIVAQDLTSEEKVHGFITTGDVAKTGAGTGAWVGGIFGLLVGAGFFWVPAVGPILVVGSLASVLLGGIEGAVAGGAGGGLLGALVGWGVSRKHILKYEEKLKGGKYLVIAHGSDDDVAKAKGMLQETKPEELEEHKGEEENK